MSSSSCDVPVAATRGTGNKGRSKKKGSKTRSSRSVCQERYACKGTSQAFFSCEDCKTLQCEACENLLHENSRFEFHTRHPIPKTPVDLLCQHKACEDANLADVTCKECELRFCYACDSSVHLSGAAKKHTREPIPTSKASANNISNNSGEKETNSVAALSEDAGPLISNNNTRTKCKSKKSLAQNGGTATPPDQDETGRWSPALSDGFDGPLPDIAQMSLEPGSSDQFVTADFSGQKSSPLHSMNSKKKAKNEIPKSFLVLDENEQMQITSTEEFASKLGCSPDAPVKVVSIFGNTGEGKSHTLNFTFFGGAEVFKTSPAQSSCTIGIWAAYDPQFRVVTIDTEGLLGVSENNNRRTRLLLKVLAISDVIVYRTRAERLHNDLFSFLGDASRAYGQHFHTELREASKRSGQCYTPTDLGPVVVVFHETLHTKVLQRTDDKSPEDELRRRFQSLNLTTESYSAFEYVGTQTQNPPTNFKGLQAAMKRHLNNTMVRSARKVSIVYGALKHLNEKFSGDIEKTVSNTFPDEYFTCSTQCESCGTRCTRSLNHHRDGLSHFSDAKCKYQHQFDNKVYYCKACNERGEDVLVVPKTSACNDPTWVGLAKYAWYGYVLECSRCGVIFRSRQYWYGNSDPFNCVRTEILHIWPGENHLFQGTQNAAQKVIDGIQYITSTAQSISARPTRQLGSWVADQIAPSYWVPNSLITHCRLCETKFEDTDVKHHCRACGYGFCDDCSSKKCEVPDKGWPDPVRVCDICYEKRNEFRDLPLRQREEEDDGDLDDSVSSEAYSETPSKQEILLPRKAAEVISSTLGNVASAIEVPMTWIKDSARPEYWEADKDIHSCCVCGSSFAEKKLTIHHCRACGKGVCDPCSQTKRPVKTRGWDGPVRVCDTCVKKTSL